MPEVTKKSGNFSRSMKTRRIILFGIPFDTVSEEQAVLKLHYYSQLSKGDQKVCVTPNPEMIVEASRNPEFHKILHDSDLSLADGTGILWASGFLPLSKLDVEAPLHKKFSLENFTLGIISLFRFLFSRKKYEREIRSRVTGIDVFGRFVATSQAKIFLLGGAEGAAKEIAEKFENIVGIYDGFVEPEIDEQIVQEVNASGAEALFVALGSPKQEFWIAKNISQMPSIRFAMGVGGAFDFLTGKQKRAPQWMRDTGLEWVYRFVHNPFRATRMFNATVRFFFLTVKERYRARDTSSPIFGVIKSIVIIGLISYILFTVILGLRLMQILGG
jgi:N-acetylglucosaminyldiphosphoundecaprenol N-acetyl-beta-D-mannosaminyltransferase